MAATVAIRPMAIGLITKALANVGSIAMHESTQKTTLVARDECSFAIISLGVGRGTYPLFRSAYCYATL